MGAPRAAGGAMLLLLTPRQPEGGRTRRHATSSYGARLCLGEISISCTRAGTSDGAAMSARRRRRRLLHLSAWRFFDSVTPNFPQMLSTVHLRPTRFLQIFCYTRCISRSEEEICIKPLNTHGPSHQL